MNPPPYRPPQEDKNPILRQALKASLIALPVAALMIFLVIHAIAAQRKATASRAAWQDMKSSGRQMHEDQKKNFDPKTGITNVDLGKLDKMREALKNVAQNSSGDEAGSAQALTRYLERLQAATKEYQTAATKLREAHVLDQFDSSDQAQIPARREIVQQFLDANAAFRRVVTNCEDRLRADLTQAKVREFQIESIMEGVHSSMATKNALLIGIRQCDDRIGGSMLDALNTLDKEWGHWKSDSATDKIRFENTAAREAYNNDLAAIKAAAAEQLKLQARLVNLPIPQP